MPKINKMMSETQPGRGVCAAAGLAVSGKQVGDVKKQMADLQVPKNQDMPDTGMTGSMKKAAKKLTGV